MTTRTFTTALAEGVSAWAIRLLAKVRCMFGPSKDAPAMCDAKNSGAFKSSINAGGVSGAFMAHGSPFCGIWVSQMIAGRHGSTCPLTWK